MPLRDVDRQRLDDYYKQSLDMFGPNAAESLHWSNRRNQLIRFDVLISLTKPSGKSLLDVGCGLGDLYGYLVDKRIVTEYTGIDIVAELVTSAKKKYPEAHFETRDIFSVTQQYDIVVASGALSFKVENNLQYYQDMIKKMYGCAGEGLAFNMLDRNAHIDDDTFAAYDPKEISDFCKSLSPHVEIVNDYLPQDFTVFLHK